VKPFIVNRSGRLVFPSNFFPDLDFAAFDTLEQFEAVIKRDFDRKAATAADIEQRMDSQSYSSRYELLRELAQHLFWVNRYAITMYEKRPTRWRDVPRHRDDVFLPILVPWEGAERAAARIKRGYEVLPSTWNETDEDDIFNILFNAFLHEKHVSAELPVIKPTVAELMENPSNRTFELLGHDPDYPAFGYDDIIEARQDTPELEALTRQAMVLHNQYLWDAGKTRLTEIAKIPDDHFVVVFQPRTQDVLRFIARVKEGSRPRRGLPEPAPSARPLRPFPPVEVAKRFAVMPRIESLAVYEGEHACSNDDLIRNTAYSWSPMSAEDIARKTGIKERRYTELDLDHIALLAARGALEKAGRGPEEIGAVLFCSCTTGKLVPSLATWLSGQLGMFQTHNSCDVVAACAGLPYGVAEAIRLLQEVERPVLVVCGEKFSHTIGNVRPSRMIFGDGAAALVIGPAPEGERPDVEVFQTYASGPMNEVDSIIWPNRHFDNNITVYGPDVAALVKRYLTQMLGELADLCDAHGGRLVDAIELIIPHQANKTMVTKIAEGAGVAPERLYFNIERVGNTSSASIPLALYDAVREGVIDQPKLVFTPGFGAGAVGGYLVMRFDPAVVAAPIEEGVTRVTF
jgi:3-oxoacyl-[acyl-carrier-protein] synthase-3